MRKINASKDPNPAKKNWIKPSVYNLYNNVI